MARIAELHDGTRLEFPDETSDEVIQRTVKRTIAERAVAAPKPNAFKEAGKSDPTRGIVSTLQGPLMNFADEGLAAVQGGIDRVFKGIPFDTARQQWRDYYRGASEQFQQDNPVLAPALQVGATLATGMGARDLLARGGMSVPTVASVLNPTGALGRVGTAALAGGGAGAIGGAGAANEMADIPAEALKGGALGAITGGTVNAIGQGGGALGNNIIGRAGNSRIVQDRLRDTGIGGSIARNIATTADDLAKQRVATAMARDGRTPEQVAARLRTLGPDTPLAVGAGKNTLDLLDTMATMPGRTADDAERLIRQQQAGRSARLTTAAQNSLGTGGARLNDSLEAWAAKREADAGPIYDAIRNVPVAADERLQRILRRPVVQDALAQARVSAANADEVLPDIKAGEAVPMAVWDRIKRGLDDVIGLKKRGVDAGTANNAAKSTLGDAQRTKQELLAVLDEMVPDYKRARDAFAGPSALIDAAEEGRKAMRMDDVGIQGLTRGMSQSELEAFRVGAFEAIRAKVGKEGGQTELLKMWKEPATQEKLRALFPDLRSYREFAAEVAKEARRKAVETVGRGSQTASRQARMDDEAAGFLTGAVDIGAAAKMGNPLGLMSAARNLYGRTVMPEPVRDRIGGLLMTPSQDAPALLGDLSRYVSAEQARRAAAANRTGLLGGVGINSLLGQ